MPAQEITDLSDLLTEPKPIRFEPGGEVFTLPGDIPVELYLEINRRAQEDLTVDTIGGLHEKCLELLQIHQPELEKLPCSLTQMIMLIPRVYGGASPPKKPAKPRASRAKNPSMAKPARSARGATTTKTPAKRRSGSG